MLQFFQPLQLYPAEKIVTGQVKRLRLAACECPVQGQYIGRAAIDLLPIPQLLMPGLPEDVDNLCFMAERGEGVIDESIGFGQLFTELRQGVGELHRIQGQLVKQL